MTPRTRALKIQGPFVNLLSFRQMQPFPRLLSISMALKRSCALSLPLCLFILAHCQDPHHGDNKTDIDQFVLACSHTFNVRYSSPHSPSQSNTCHQHPVDPTANNKRQSLLPARVSPLSKLLRSNFPFLLDFDLRGTFFRRPSSRVLFFGRLQYRSFLDDSNTV